MLNGLLPHIVTIFKNVTISGFFLTRIWICLSLYPDFECHYIAQVPLNEVLKDDWKIFFQGHEFQSNQVLFICQNKAKLLFSGKLLTAEQSEGMKQTLLDLCWVTKYLTSRSAEFSTFSYQHQ